MSCLEIERDGTPVPFRPGFTASEKAVYPQKIKLNAPGRAIDIARVQIAHPCFVIYQHDSKDFSARQRRVYSAGDGRVQASERNPIVTSALPSQ